MLAALRKLFGSWLQGRDVPPARLRYPIREIEQAERRGAWSLISELWLDTEVDKNFLARSLALLPYSLEELDEICVLEVAPQVYPNLESITGEWAGFNDEWLARRINEAMKAPDWRETAWRLRTRSMRLAGDDWSEVRGMIEDIRSKLAGPGAGS